MFSKWCCAVVENKIWLIALLSSFPTCAHIVFHPTVFRFWSSYLKSYLILFALLLMINNSDLVSSLLSHAKRNFVLHILVAHGIACLFFFTPMHSFTYIDLPTQCITYDIGIIALHRGCICAVNPCECRQNTLTTEVMATSYK